jgi:hypothetical protein
MMALLVTVVVAETASAMLPPSPLPPPPPWAWLFRIGRVLEVRGEYSEDQAVPVGLAAMGLDPAYARKHGRGLHHEVVDVRFR